MKKVISVLLSFAVIINIFAILSAGTFTAQAADYGETLRSKGFPESYINDLVALHNAHPKWIFEPLKTNLDFQTAVNGERKTHKSQLIQKLSSTSTSMYCDCSSCKKNGNYVIQEGSSWVSASETAVKYYMDPRNFLNEKEIFQFESIAYDGTQTQSGVEAILKGTWMYDTPISYYNTAGNYVTLASKITYSDSIMSSALRSGMSAYYLASKIRQENGGATASALAVSGKTSPFQGIFNYYNIGANTGALDGLAWAAGYLKLEKNATLYSTYNTSTGKAGGTTTALKSGQYMTWIANKGDYFQVRLYTESPYKEGDSGYILKSDVRKTYTNLAGSTGSDWGRPWYSPHISICFGAMYIAQNYKTQMTGYLQKFNVSPASSSLYTHEYMANVAAAAAEAVTTYSGYKNANILDVTKTFSIPVFNNMPNDNTEKMLTPANVSGLTATGADSKSITVSWNPVSDATGYRVDVYKDGAYSYCGITSGTTYTISGLTDCTGYKIRVKAYKTVSGKNYYSNIWAGTSYATRAVRVSNFRASSINSNSITLVWNQRAGATGYRVYIYDTAQKKDVLYKDISGASNTSVTVTNLSSNTTYQFKIYAYLTYEGKTYNGYCSEALSVSTGVVSTGVQVANVSGLTATGADSKSITVSWNPVSGATGYRVDVYKNGSYSYCGITSGTTYTIKGLTSCTGYKIRVKAYKTVSGKNYYSNIWAGTSYATRAVRVSNFRTTGSNNAAIYLAWNKTSGATGYRVYIYDTAQKKDVLYKTITGAGNTTLTVPNLKNNTKYQFKIYAYLTYEGKTYNGYCSNALSASTKYNMVTVNSAASNSTKKITVKWNKAYYACTGYEVMWSTTSNFSSNFLSVYVNGQNTLSTTLTTAQSGKYYYVRVRAYKTENSKKTYGSWSTVKTVKVK
ncbi:MAG: fibronectin type III domain-containing protein [Eubacterium sp.]|nr:fibronectin type III domain-containing protein [Eubacterium sp.]